MLPGSVAAMFQTQHIPSHSYPTSTNQFRQNNLIQNNFSRLNIGKNFIKYSLPSYINSLSNNITNKVNTHSLLGFKSYVKIQILMNYNTVCRISNCYVCTNQNRTPSDTDMDS